MSKLMNSNSPLVFKTATEEWEFEQIHRLNYKTFVEEIAQHPPNPSRRLVDKFHAENTYLVCLCDRQVVGMMAVRGKRPFSLDQKLPELDSYLPAGRTICEIRLLAVEKDFRYGQVFKGLLALLWQHGIEQSYDLAIISGTTRQQKLYHHLGFMPFGPLVGAGDAMFQPMYVTLETFEAGAREFLRTAPARSFLRNSANFLPGPVAVPRDVRRAFEESPESHRSDAFVADFQEVKRLLCELTRAGNVEILLGSGTVANDAVAGQLSLERSPGIVLSNGEFGGRLIDHARRFGLDFAALEFAWGMPLELEAVRRLIESSSKPACAGQSAAGRPAWLWCVHCETSTSVLNDLEALKGLCAEYEIKLCLDCISSIGTLPVNLEGVYLASGASGKGLRSYPGLSMVFYNHALPAPDGALPRYLDLKFYAGQNGIPFTHSSNLLHALHAAINDVAWAKRFSELEEASNWLRARLCELGFALIGSRTTRSPAVVTIALRPELSSAAIGRDLQEAGYLLSFNSEYLRRRNWIQICLMGEFSREKLTALLALLHRLCFGPREAAAAIDAAPSAASLLG